MGFSIWRETYGNGVLIGMMMTITKPRLNKIRLDLNRVCDAPYVVVNGLRQIHITSDVHSETAIFLKAMVISGVLGLAYLYHRFSLLHKLSLAGKRSQSLFPLYKEVFMDDGLVGGADEPIVQALVLIGEAIGVHAHGVEDGRLEVADG